MNTAGKQMSAGLVAVAIESQKDRLVIEFSKLLQVAHKDRQRSAGKRGMSCWSTASFTILSHFSRKAEQPEERT